MDCVRREISKELDGELDEAGKALVRDHLEKCRDCREFRQSLLELRSLHSRLDELEPDTLGALRILRLDGSVQVVPSGHPGSSSSRGGVKTRAEERPRTMKPGGLERPPGRGIWYAHRDSNPNPRLRRPVLYPLSYGRVGGRLYARPSR